MPRPNRDRVMVTFYLERPMKELIGRVAAERQITQADAFRMLLQLGAKKLGYEQRAKAKPR